MLDLEAVAQCYQSYKQNKKHYVKIDKYYYANTDNVDVIHYEEGKSKARVVDNFLQLFVDQEAQYSFGNPLTYTYKEEIKENIADVIKDNTFNTESHDSSLGQKLIEFGIMYELSFISKKGFKNKLIPPTKGKMYYDENDEPQFFIYVYRQNSKEYINVYDDTYVYKFDNSFKSPISQKEHGFNCIPVGVGRIGDDEYSVTDGYVKGDKTLYRMIKTNQDAYSQTKSLMHQEVIDFRNAILKLFGVKLRDKKDDEGNVILDKDGNPEKSEPVLSDTKILAFKDKKVSDAEWLVKTINDTFIQNMLKVYRDDMHTLTCHVDCNEKMQSNLSGIALRSRLQALEAKCTANVHAYMDIIKTRLECLFYYLSSIRKGYFDYKKVNIQITVCVPVDDSVIADMISKIPQEVVSNYTKRGWISKISDLDLEQKRIDKEVKKDLENFQGLDKPVKDDNNEVE